MAVSLFGLLVSAALPVVNVFFMCALGAALAKKGILDGRARQLLSQLIFWIFVPSLTFSKLASSVNLQDLAVWWILPFNMVISITIGLAVGWGSARILKVEPWFGKHFMCTIALGNVGNLPIVLIQSICANKKTLFATALPGDQCEKLGIAYIAFSMWIASTFQYCVAFNLLKKPKQPESPEKRQVDAEVSIVLQMSEQQPSNAGAPHGKGTTEQKPAKPTPLSFADRQSSTSRSGPIALELQIAPTAARKQAQSEDYKGAEKAESREQYSEEPSSDQQRPNEEEHAPLVSGQESSGWLADHGRQSHQEGAHWWQQSEAGTAARRKKQKEIQRWLKGIPWGSYLNAPTCAAAAGLTVGCISPLKNVLFGDSAALAFISQSLEIMAGGMIPCMMLVLGGSLAKGPGVAKLEQNVIVGTLIVRLVVIPALGTAVVMSLLKLGVFSSPDPLFLMVLLLCHATPTAMNLQTVATLNQNGEEEMSCLLCWEYLASVITLPLWMALFVALVSP